VFGTGQVHGPIDSAPSGPWGGRAPPSRRPPPWGTLIGSVRIRRRPGCSATNSSRLEGAGWSRRDQPPTCGAARRAADLQARSRAAGAGASCR
jgi:hypothetical protein